MSEYVFNPASNDAAATTPVIANSLAINLLQVLAELDSRLEGAPRPLKLPRHPWELPFGTSDAGDPLSLGEIVAELYQSADTRDLAAFFDALMCYAPATEQLDEAAIEAILRLTPTASVAGNEIAFEAVLQAEFEALQCVVTGGVLVSAVATSFDFDHARFYCGDQLVQFDHASLIRHVDEIIGRQHGAAKAALTRQNFSAVRGAAFPHLCWGRDVNGQIAGFPSEYMSLAFCRLAKLDEVVGRWRGSTAPAIDTLGLNFRDESELTMANYRNDRRFRSASGEMQTYEKHIWIDRGNRIHFLLDATAKNLEIGYIGPHLRTWRF